MIETVDMFPDLPCAVPAVDRKPSADVYLELVGEWGPLVSLKVAAVFCGRSYSAVYTACQREKLRLFVYGGDSLVPLCQVLAWAGVAKYSREGFFDLRPSGPVGLPKSGLKDARGCGSEPNTVLPPGNFPVLPVCQTVATRCGSAKGPGVKITILLAEPEALEFYAFQTAQERELKASKWAGWGISDMINRTLAVEIEVGFRKAFGKSFPVGSKGPEQRAGVETVQQQTEE